MKNLRVPFIVSVLSRLSACLLTIIAASVAFANYFVTPPTYAEQEAPGEFGLFTSPGYPAGTYVLLIHERLLTGLRGQTITGLTFRLDGDGLLNWPTNELTFYSFQYLVGYSVSPSAATTRFMDNFIGGWFGGGSGAGLTIPPNSWQATGQGPNPWGFEFPFTQSDVYNGGHLGIYMSYALNIGGYNGSMFDAAPVQAPGYGTDYAAVWDQMDGSGQGSLGAAFTVIRFTTVPEPTSLGVLTAGVLGALLMRRRRKVR